MTSLKKSVFSKKKSESDFFDRITTHRLAMACWCPDPDDRAFLIRRCRQRLPAAGPAQTAPSHHVHYSH